MDISKTTSTSGMVNMPVQTKPVDKTAQASSSSQLAATNQDQDNSSPSTIVKLQSTAAQAGQSDNKDSSAASSTGGAVKSFTYGVLNLPDPNTEPPAETAKPDSGYFTAGRWVAAAVTVGTIISLVV